MLQDAIRAKDFQKAKEIIKSSADPFEGMQDYQITGIFDTLVREKAFDVIDMLIEKGAIELDIYEYDSFNKSIFMSLIKNLRTNEESIAYLNDFIPRIQNLNDELEGKSLLSVALENEVDVELVKVCVNNGCDVNLIDRSEGNLIHQVVKKYTRTYDKGIAYLELFYEQGLDIEKPNVVQETPLHIAVREHHMPYIKWLLDNGANPNTQDKNGVSPFYHAVANAIDLEKYQLMRAYATPDFDQRTNNGEGILFESVRMGCSPELLKLLLEDGADLYETSTYYSKQATAMDAFADKSPEIIQTVIDSDGFDVNRQDDEGNTLLHKICNRHTINENTRAKEIYRNVKLLLAAGADPRITNNKEETVMMIASTDNLKSKTVELLLNHK
jgi:uncharacterized protein